MTGPNILYDIVESDYQKFLRSKKAWPWYAEISPSFRPGAFTHTDGDGVPDEQDTIWFGPAEWKLLKAAVQKKLEDLSSKEKMAVDLAFHEWLHNLVPSARVAFDKGVDRWKLAEKYSHPTEPWPAIKHAHRTGYKVNAFSRIVRRNDIPDKRPEFNAWLLEAAPAAVRRT